MRALNGMLFALVFAGLLSPLQGLAAVSTTTTLAVTPAGPVPFEQTVTMTATITDASSSAVLHGSVTFYDGAMKLGTAQIISNGSAGFTPGTAIYRTRSLAQGSHSLTARFNGTATDLTSTSGAQALTIGAAAGPYASATVLALTGTTNGQYGLNATVGGLGPDIPTGNVSFNDTTTSVALGTAGLTAGSEEFMQTANVLLPLCPQAMVGGDFNNDGDRDLAVLVSCLNSSGTLTAMLGNGAGGFTAAASSSTPVIESTPQVFAADFNGDGNLDVAVGIGSNFLVFPGNGDGTFQAPLTSTLLEYTLAGVADFNGDGIPDLLVSQGANVGVFPGNGDGTFGSPVFTLFNTDPSAGTNIPEPLVIGDVNNDGKADLVIGYGTEIGVVLGKGDGSFQQPAFYQIGNGGEECLSCDPQNVYQEAVSVGLADLAHTGNLDIVVASAGDGVTLPPQVSILAGNGSGTFPSYVTYPLATGAVFTYSTNTLVIGDLEYHGQLDVSVGGYVLAGNGDKTFQAAEPLPGFSPPLGQPTVPPVVGDFTNNGDPDVVSFGYTANVESIFLLQPAFAATATLSDITFTGSGSQQVAASYPGDTNFAANTSNAVTVALGIPAKISVTIPFFADGAQSGTAIAGYPISLIATVTEPAGNPVPTGTVQFYVDGAASGGPVAMSGGTANFSDTWATAGNHSIVGEYSGDSNYSPAVSAACGVPVVSQGSILAGIAGVPGSAMSGVPFTTTVTAEALAWGPLPTGTVSWSVATNDPVTLNSANPPTASLTLNTATQPLAVGHYMITATYSGNSVWLASKPSDVAPITIEGTTSLSISNSGPSTVASGTPVTITGSWWPTSLAYCRRAR